MAKVQAILFDMDGVLVDSEAYIAEAGAALLNEKYGVPARVGDFLAFVGMGENRYLSGVAALYGVTLDLAVDKAWVYARYAEVVKGRLEPLPGAVAFVRACRAAGLKTALATSADRTKMLVNLREIGLSEADFDATVNGLDVERKKPFPDVFLEAARRIGIAPSGCWVVEDAVAGVQAAKAAGCRCLALETTFPGQALLEAGADRLVANLAAVTVDEFLILR